MVGRQYLVHWPQHNPCLSPKLQIQRAKLKLCIFAKLEREQDIFNIRIAMNEEEGDGTKEIRGIFLRFQE